MIDALITLAQSQGVDLTTLIYGVVAALVGSGGTAWLTLKRTNRKLEAEGEKIYQDALKVAEDRAQTSFNIMKGLADTLEARLAATDNALEAARARVEAANARISELNTRAEMAERERDLALIAATAERDQLQARIIDLEERVADLLARLPGRRRRDDHGQYKKDHEDGPKRRSKDDPRPPPEGP